MSQNDGLAIWGLVIGALSLIVTAVGFGLTISQVRKTKDAAIATKDAIVAANRRMLYNHLLVLLPQMKNFEGDLDAAIAEPDKASAIRALVGFSHAANQVAALLETDGVAHAALIVELRATARAASVAKGELESGNARPLTSLLQSIAVEVSTVAAECAGLSTAYQTKVA